jgi:hypothetical protein
MATAKPKAEKPTTSEVLSGNIVVPDGEASPPEAPPGSPSLTPFHALGRRRKAQFMALLDSVQEASEKRAKGIATLFAMGADVEDAIRVAALIPAEAEAWLTSCDDDDLMQLFFSYTGRMGEAMASSSS